MSTHIAGYDGSAASYAAVEWAQRLAPRGAETIAANVYPHVTLAWELGVDAISSDELEAERRGTAEEILETCDIPGVSTRAVRAHSVSGGLHALAEETSARLIAVGATHRWTFGRMAPGSAAANLLHGSTCPILVAPAESGSRELTAIGVGYDGTPESHNALLEARALAAETGARLVLVAAYAPVALSVPMAPADIADGGTRFRRELSATVDAVAADVGPGVETRVLTGTAGKVLAEDCSDLDLMVVGSRGWGPLGSVLAGSVSRYVVDHARNPVLVVPRPRHAHAFPHVLKPSLAAEGVPAERS